MYNYRMKSKLLKANKTGFNIMIVHFYIRRKLDVILMDVILYDI